MMEQHLHQQSSLSILFLSLILYSNEIDHKEKLKGTKGIVTHGKLLMMMWMLRRMKWMMLMMMEANQGGEERLGVQPEG